MRQTCRGLIMLQNRPCQEKGAANHGLATTSEFLKLHRWPFIHFVSLWCLLQNYSVTLSSFSCFVVKAWDVHKARIIMLQNRTCRGKAAVNHELARIWRNIWVSSAPIQPLYTSCGRDVYYKTTWWHFRPSHVLLWYHHLSSSLTTRIWHER